MSAHSQYDVYISAPGTDATRRATIPRIVILYPLDGALETALVRGERVLLRRKADQATAQRIVTDLRAIGCKVDLQAVDPFFNMTAGLVGLDGEEEAPAPAPIATPRRAPPPVMPQPVAKPAPAPAPRAAAPPASQFRAPSLDDESAQLTLDRAPPSYSEAERDAAAASDTVEAPRCTTHDLVRVRGRCPRCDADDAYVKSRLLGGSLRNQPQLRLGIGVGAGLVLGWILTAPMSRHGDMRVQDIREQAQRERERPTEEGQAKAAQLESDADDAHQSELFKTYGLWGLVTAAVTALWFKLT